MENKRKLTKRTMILAVGAMALAAVLVTVLWILPSKHLEGWTVMVYMVGSDLESEHNLASKDLREMADALRPDTRLLVMTEGITDWEDCPNDGTCRIWEVNASEHTLLGSFTGSMGDPVALQSLLTVGLSEAKGQTALILWDHGYGPMEGFGNDMRSAEDKRLSLSDLTQALRDSGCEEHPLSMIGFDACLMAGCETALTLRPYAQWLLASQETEPPEGWDYSFLRELKPDTDSKNAGSEVIRAFKAHYEKLYTDYPQYRQPYTLSLTDLRALDDLEQSISSLFRVMETDIQEARYRVVGSLRLRAWGFGRSTTSSEFDLIDLRELAEACDDHSSEASAVKTALDKCVVISDGSEPLAHGLSVYFPQFGAIWNEHWNDSWKSRLESLQLPEDWKHFLYAYADALNTQGPAYEHTAMAVTEPDQYAIELSEDELRDFVRAGYYVLMGDPEEGLALICARQAYSLDGNRVTVPFHNQILSMTADGETIPLVSFWRQEDEQTAHYLSYALLQRYDPVQYSISSDVVQIRIEQDIQTGDWHVLSAFRTTEDELVTGRQSINLEDYQDLIAPMNYYLPTRDSHGRLIPYGTWTYVGYEYPIPSLNIQNGYTVEETLLSQEGGPYWLQIFIWDVYNQKYASELIPIVFE